MTCTGSEYVKPPLGKPVWDRHGTGLPGAGAEHQRAQELEDLVGQSEATARSGHLRSGARSRRVGRSRAGGKLERLPRGTQPGPVGAPGAAELGEAASGGSAVALDKGLRGGRAGFPSLDPEARRPLPAASPASGAGAGQARHLLRIDADTASRAFPAPGMQRRWRAGRCLERGRARSLRALPPSLSCSSPRGWCWGSGGWQAGAVGSLSPSLPLPAARRPPHEAAFSTRQELGFGFQILLLPLSPLCGPGRIASPLWASLMQWRG